MRGHYIKGAILGVISLCLISVIIHTELFQSLELKFLDYKFLWRPRHKPNPNIVIVAIDDSSIDTIGRWPWPRNIHAGLLKTLSEHPPRVIGFDILFTEPEDDTALAYYSRLLGNVVYAGYISNVPVTPIKELRDTALTGFINAPPDRDGIIRKIPLVFRHDNTVLPSFTLQVISRYLDMSIEDLYNIPVDNNGYMWINYAGDQHVFKEITFQQALTLGENQRFGNSLLLIGVTATGIGDQGHIPFATNVPLITVHANALNTILNKDFLIKAPFWINFVLIAVCVLGGTVINLFFRSIRAVLLSLLLLVVYIAVNLWLFQQNIILDVLGPSFGIILPFVLITVYRYGWEERQRRWIKKVFAHYLASDVIETMLKDPGKLRLGGELVTATVLNLDLRNFSTYCEGRPPAEVVGFLNQTFDWMTEIILRHGGMLDKYIGDAIMVIFGAPMDLPPPKQARSAVLTAMEIIESWNRLPGDVRANLDIGIGINTGPMLIGNMGSRYIFNYTAIGDEVNIASRIQGLTSEYKVNIIITDSVHNLIKDTFKTEPLGKVPVKGRKEAVTIYRL